MKFLLLSTIIAAGMITRQNVRPDFPLFVKSFERNFSAKFAYTGKDSCFQYVTLLKIQTGSDHKVQSVRLPDTASEDIRQALEKIVLKLNVSEIEAYVREVKIAGEAFLFPLIVRSGKATCITGKTALPFDRDKYFFDGINASGLQMEKIGIIAYPAMH